MAEHDHTTHVTGCYRCEIGRDEVAEQSAREVMAFALDLRGDFFMADVVIRALAAVGYSVVKVPDREALRRAIESGITREQGTYRAGDSAADAVLALFTEATDG